MACVADLADTTQCGAWAARSSTSGHLAYAMTSAPLTAAARPGAPAIAGARQAPGRSRRVTSRPAAPASSRRAVRRRRGVPRRGPPPFPFPLLPIDHDRVGVGEHLRA